MNDSLLLNEFITEECDKFTRKLLLDEIEKQIKNPICEKREFEFNVFNIELDFVNRVVKIEDDLDSSDDSTITLTFNEFCNRLQQA